MILGVKRSMVLQLVTAIAVVISGCNSEEKKTAAVAKTPAKPGLMQPFRFHKVIEISPGNSFDIFSWGRGAAATGSFLILASDSAEAKYTTTTGDLDGAITDVYNTDLDMDGNPEILIQAKSKDSTVHTQIYAFEYKDHKAQKLDFPKLTSAQKKGYHGDDNFYLKEGILMREFPVRDEKDSTAKTDKRILEYGIRNNNFTVKTVSQEDLDRKQTAVSKQDSSKKVVSATSNTPTKNASQKKHHVAKRKSSSARKSFKKKSHSGKKHRRHRR